MFKLIPSILRKNIFIYIQNKPFSISGMGKFKSDPYLILEINRNSDWPTIKKNYFRLARIYHPDLNKNDERASKKFLQIKEAYEYFDRKYNPEKYVNIRQSYSSKFDDELRNSNEESKEQSTENFESIREKNKKKKTVSPEGTFEFKSDEFSFESNGDYFRDEQLKLDIEKQKNISSFLFTKNPVPRSRRMVDRLQLKDVTLSKGKFFGADDFLGFTVLTFILLYIYMNRKNQYKHYSFENLENVNIYNALKVSEINKIYQENEISPAEQVIINTKEHLQYKNKMNIEKLIDRTKSTMLSGAINDVPKLDIKKKYKESLSK